MPQKGYTGVSVPDDDYEQASELKPDTVTWGDVLLTGAEELSYGDDSGGSTEIEIEPTLDSDAVDELVAELESALGGVGAGENADLEEIKSALSTVESRTNRIEKTLDNLTQR